MPGRPKMRSQAREVLHLMDAYLAALAAEVATHSRALVRLRA